MTDKLLALKQISSLVTRFEEQSGSYTNTLYNEMQVRRLGLQLMTPGYEIWCDVFNLKEGEKFWKEIENEIGNNTCKFLYELKADELFYSD